MNVNMGTLILFDSGVAYFPIDKNAVYSSMKLKPVRACSSLAVFTLLGRYTGNMYL